MKRLFEWVGLRKREGPPSKSQPPDPRVTAGRLGIAAAVIGLVKTLIDVFTKR